MLGSLESWWDAAQHAAAILEDPATTPASWHQRFQREVLEKLPCFGPYWSKYVYGDVAEHIAGDRADLCNFSMVGPGCEYWLRFMGLLLQRGARQVQQQGLEALRELRDVVNKVLASGRHRGLEKARTEVRLEPLTVYDVQVQSCECKRGFRMVSRVAAARKPLWEAEAPTIKRRAAKAAEGLPQKRPKPSDTGAGVLRRVSLPPAREPTGTAAAAPSIVS